MYFRSRIHTDLGFFDPVWNKYLQQSHCKPTSILPYWASFTEDQSSLRMLEGLVFIKSAAEGSSTVFPFPYPRSSVMLCPWRSAREAITTLPMGSPRQGQQCLSFLTLSEKDFTCEKLTTKSLIYLKPLIFNLDVFKLLDFPENHDHTAFSVTTFTFQNSTGFYFYSTHLTRAQTFSDSKLVPRFRSISLQEKMQLSIFEIIHNYYNELRSTGSI